MSAKWDFEVSSRAEHDLAVLPRETQVRIFRAVVRLAADPFGSKQVKRLKDSDFYRLRVGEYQVLYSVDRRRRFIRIEGVRHRREAYR